MNNKDKLRFAFVSNSMEIAAIVKALINPEQEYLEVHEASMEEAVPLAEDLLRQGVEVIIGGGATGKLLRQSSHLSVACISRTAVDILRALMKARDYGTKIGLSSYESPETGIDLLEELLNISIRHFTFSSTQGLIENITLAKESGIHCMVGSAIMGKIARSMGLESVVVYPGKDVILHTLESARTLAVAKRNERRKGERMRIILEAISEGVIGVDLQGRVNVYNDSAARYFDINQEDILGKPLPDILRGTGIVQVLQSGEPDIDQVRRIASKDMFINTLPVMVNGRQEAVISTFKPISRIQNIDKKITREHLARGFVARYTLDHLKGTSPAMAELRQKADKYARTDASIMIIGQTGTGKEILAQAIHNASAFKNMPFVAVNCSALPESLLESELFGYEEGAFTGAKRGGKTGLFEIANQGTIFLDEIADIPKSLQVRLLRVLEEKEIMRLGGDRIISVDVR
ncbi:MAG: sigma 54-interacting transcriptional regulator, partial [Desulfonatronovibrio sp.]